MSRLGTIRALVLTALLLVPLAHAEEPFVVGKQTATEGLIRPFKPTRVQLPTEPLDQDGRRLLVRELLAEMGFAMRAIPVGPPGIVLHANGRMDPDIEELKTRLYKKGTSLNQGDRFQITHLEFKPDRIILDLNGGPYPPHRFLRHIELNGLALAPDGKDIVTGSRIILVFEGRVPNLSGPEVKLLLEPILDFGVKSSAAAYADTLPDWLQTVVKQHDVLVGMNHKMVLAALGQPVMKVREHPNGGTDGEVLEEWIYGRQPEIMHFVRFRGDRVVLVKIAALGKPIEIHDKDEMNGYKIAQPERRIALGDQAPPAPGEDPGQHRAPSLLKDNEKPISGTQEKITVPKPKQEQGTTSAPPAATPPQP
ncbi:MAG: hypothetical protein JSS87_12905 [Acidobacteria bacterium]|nr:hypothetical protein [Acidobacteriota bacterium]